jgi:hypothetical protein
MAASWVGLGPEASPGPHGQDARATWHGFPRYSALRAERTGWKSLCDNSSFDTSGFAALLCGRADPLPCRPTTPLFLFASRGAGRKGRAFPHSGAAEPRVSAVFTHTLEARDASRVRIPPLRRTASR